MTTDLINVVTQFFRFSWLTGPIFDKELRVSSRRRRNYVLRFAYLALMTIFLVLVWLEEVQQSGSSVYRISRMARAGQTIIMFIIWFQFLATQLVAVIMLSTSISDEIYNRRPGRAPLRLYALSSLPTSESVKFAPSNLMCGITCKSIL